MITGVMMDQIRSLRARAVVERIVNHSDDGAYIKIGNSCSKVLTETHRLDDIPTYSPACLDEAAAVRAAATPTFIRMMTLAEYDLRIRHGFEVADYTLYAYHADATLTTRFKILGYESIRQQIGF
jgi:hypothetical protein